MDDLAGRYVWVRITHRRRLGWVRNREVFYGQVEDVTWSRILVRTPDGELHKLPLVRELLKPADPDANYPLDSIEAVNPPPDYVAELEVRKPNRRQRRQAKNKMTSDPGDHSVT